jgi:hypothetical protein
MFLKLNGFYAPIVVVKLVSGLKRYSFEILSPLLYEV